MVSAKVACPARTCRPASQLGSWAAWAAGQLGSLGSWAAWAAGQPGQPGLLTINSESVGDDSPKPAEQ